MRFPLIARVVVVGFVAVVILIPLQLVHQKISERQRRAAEVERSFALETSGPQIVVGPLLALTCEETVTDEREIKRAGKAETVTVKRAVACPTVYITPKKLEVSGNVPVEQRYRGIYPIGLYRASLKLSGQFEWPEDAIGNGINPRHFKQAYLVHAVSDPRGIKSVSLLAWGDRDLAFSTSGTETDPRFSLQAELGAYSAAKPATLVPFKFAIELVGTSSIRVAPVGDTTSTALVSSWPHPSFTGNWMPDERRIGADGFDASWRTTHFAAGGQALWNKRVADGSLFNAPLSSGVAFFNPLNVYSLSHRATEYGFLFVLFTFTALALTELLGNVRLHVIQYMLIGSALAIFFLLLIALCEHIAFARAYLAASMSCVALLTFYLRHPLGTLARTATFLFLFTGLYALLYVLLRSEDHALLLGSLFVFALLAVVMVFTRKVDWSGVSSRLASPLAAPAGPGMAP